MREMKDSGIAWIGEIPAYWETPKMKYIAENITDFTASGSFADLAENVKYLDYEDYAMLVRTVDLSAKRKIQHIYVNRHAYDYLKNSNLHGGELILPNIGSVGMIYKYVPLYKRSTLAPNSIMIRSQNNNYLYYLFYNTAGEEALKRLSSATTQAKFNKTQLRNLKVILPNLEEQQKIADFLDAKCGEIDGILGDIEAQVETLDAYKRSVITEAVTKGLHPDAEMKDSGVEWIGEIPADWETRKIKFLPNKSINSYVDGDWIESPVITDDGIPYYTTGNIGDGKFKVQGAGFISEETFIALHCKYAYSGDLIISRLNAPYGRSCILPDFVDKCIVAVDNVILRTDENKRYICYVTQCSGYQKSVEDKSSGTTMKRISRIKLGNVKIPLPPLEEQQEIADFLDAKCGEIDALMAGKKEQAETLRAYKKSLIFEYVTGKKEVPRYE